MIDFKLEKFAGPLSLLLKLIEEEQLDITEVSLAKIADQFVQYIQTAGKIDPEEMADFLVVAARLLLIKSRALLPFLYPEEEQEIEELEQQLRMYKEFLEAAKKIEAIIRRQRFMFAREFNRQSFLASAHFFSPPKNLRALDLAEVLNDLIKRLEPTQLLEEEIIENRISIEEKILAIQNMVLERINLSFNNVLAEAKSKTEVIVSFLAILELMRQKQIVLVQRDTFGDIIINKYNNNYE